MSHTANRLVATTVIVLLSSVVGWLLFFPTATEAAPPSPEHRADMILHETGTRGGLIVHVGCGTGELTEALRQSNSFLVQGLTMDRAEAQVARDRLLAEKRYGPISISTFDGAHLPYADGLVNLLVIERQYQLAPADCMRVLAPGGSAYRKGKDGWTKQRKPWPADIDQWTHHLHDASGNAVARDRVVGPPAHLQWAAGPLWARSHGWTPSVSALVSASGRLFSICDESLTGMDGSVPSQWYLVARDAFSGVLLWQRPVPNWGSEQFSGTPGTGQGVTVGRFTMPTDVNKRLVAVGDTVYVTLGADAPVTAIDAASGATKRVYLQTAHADELLLSDGRLIMAINLSKGTAERAPAKRVCAVNPATGATLWQHGPLTGIRSSVGQDPYGRLELCAGDGHVFAVTTTSVVCLDAESGKLVWERDRPALPPAAVTRVGYAGMYEYKLTVLVYHAGVLLLAQPEPNTRHTYHTMPGSLYAFDAGDGHPLWKHGYGAWGHCTPPDIFVIDDTVWTHVYAETEFGFVWGHGFKAKDPSVVNYRIQALDLHTGQRKQELSTKQIFNVGHHHRCYRNKITERYLMSCRRGVEFVDLATGENYQNHWVRSGCLLGYLPCNGMLYVTPHPCQCYINAKLVGFNALKSAGQRADDDAEPAITPRLAQGPAFGHTMVPALSAEQFAAEWPMYRHDARRSGATEAALSTELKRAWVTRLASAPTGLTAAGGKIFVAGKDAHTMYALDAADGKVAWRFTADGRIDSPPSYDRGAVVFGTMHGRVYALRARDGAVAWRFNAAPRPRLVTAYGQLESPWPVPGVLARNDACWFAAGRSSYLDGGIHVYALATATGKVVHDQLVYSPDPKTGKMAPDPDGFQVPGLLNDIPTSDGTRVFIRQMNVSAARDRAAPYLYTTAGFLDSSWFNRTFWQIGRARSTGMMVLGDGVAYATEVYPARSREAVFQPAAHAYRLRCLPMGLTPRGTAARRTVKKNGKKAGTKVKAKGKARQNQARPIWERYVPMRPAAIVRAGKTLFVAGTPDVVDPKDPTAAWEGRDGGLLVAYSADDGRQLASYTLPVPPVWDGLAVADGKLLISLVDGSVLCMQ